MKIVLTCLILLARPLHAADDFDGFTWNQRAWAALAAGQTHAATESFEKAIDRSSTPSTQAEANLGIGLAAILASRPREALPSLKRAGISGSYAIAASAQLIAEATATIGDTTSALGYLRQAVEVDPYNRDALRALVRLLDKTGDKRSAWLMARRALTLDPTDEAMLRVARRNAATIKIDPDIAVGMRRIARPALSPDSDATPVPVSSRTIRVGLYGAPNGTAATVTRCLLVMNSSFQATDAMGAPRDGGNALSPRVIEYRPDTGLVEVRDGARNILFSSRQPFRFVPSARRGSVLIKDADTHDATGVDRGDREVRGAVEVLPNSHGFTLVNVVGLEFYLFGVVSIALPDASPTEAYRAQAVISRTAAVWAAAHRPATQVFDLLDDRSVQQTIGVSGEMRAATAAVMDTEGLILSKDGDAAFAPQHEDSGGRTDGGTESGSLPGSGAAAIDDSTRPIAAWQAPLDLERFIREPPDGLFSAAAPGPTAAVTRWTRLLDARDLRERVDEKRNIGRLRDVVVTQRDADGRVMALDVVGTKGTASFVGFEAIQRLLSPGSLRSAFFILRPLYDGKKLSCLIVWGAGTGSGRGFSRAGALGQAALGASWRDIVRHYFPRDDVRDLNR